MTDRPPLNELIKLTGTAVREDMEAIEKRTASQKRKALLDEMTIQRRRSQYAGLRKIHKIYQEEVM